MYHYILTQRPSKPVCLSYAAPWCSQYAFHGFEWVRLFDLNIYPSEFNTHFFSLVVSRDGYFEFSIELHHDCRRRSHRESLAQTVGRFRHIWVDTTIDTLLAYNQQPESRLRFDATAVESYCSLELEKAGMQLLAQQWFLHFQLVILKGGRALK